MYGLLTGQEILGLKLLTNMAKKVKCPLSYGLEPSGYTLRLSSEFLIPKRIATLDPIQKDKTQEKFLRVEKSTHFILYPKTFVLGKAIEQFNLPNNITAIAFTKSSYARVGIFCNITTIDAGFKGDLVIEIANLGSNPVVLHINYGIAEVLFFRHDDTEGYDGNYQNQKGIKV